MRVVTRWPALVPAIVRAGHEPVLLPPVETDTPFEYGRGTSEQDMPEPSLTARPRGAQRYPR